MKHSIILSLATLAILSGCDKSSTAPGRLPNVPIERGINTEKTTSLPEFASNIEYITLDAAPEALVGEIYMLIPSQTGFYITEKNFGSVTSGVKYFDRKGRFVSNKGRIGHGPDEYPSVSYLTVDYAGDEVYVYGTGVMAYNKDGQMVARNDSIRSPQIAYYNGELLVLKYPSLDAGRGGERSLIDKYTADLVYAGDVRVPDKGVSRVDVGFQVLSSNGNELLIKEELSDTVCSFAGDSLRPVYRLNMGRYKFPIEKLTLDAMNDWNKYYRVVNLMDSDGYLFIFLQNGLMGDQMLMVYDKNDGSCYIPKNSDGRKGLFVDGVRFNPRSIYGNQLFGELDLLDLLENKDRITDPALKAIAAKTTEQSNAILGIVHLNN